MVIVSVRLSDYNVHSHSPPVIQRKNLPLMRFVVAQTPFLRPAASTLNHEAPVGSNDLQSLFAHFVI